MKCADPSCRCHTDPAHRVITPFPNEVGPIYCCTLCARQDTSEPWRELLKYPNPDGLHPTEAAWRDRCRELLVEVERLRAHDVTHPGPCCVRGILNVDINGAALRGGAVPEKPVSDEQKLMRLFDALADSVEEMTDEEVLAEAREAGEDPKVVAAQVAGIVEGQARRALRGGYIREEHGHFDTTGTELALSGWRGRALKAEAEVARLRGLHEALLNTLAPSKSAWIQHVVRNARAALRGGE